MSTLLRPSGPLPPGVYWVRRLVALLVVVVVLLLLWWVFSAFAGGGGGSASPTTSNSTSPKKSSPSTSPSHSPSTAATKQSSPAASTTHSASKSASTASSHPASSSATAVKSCLPSAVEVSVSTDAKSYPANVQPRLNMSVRNAGTVTCRRDVGQAALELTVSTATGALVWSSDHCAPGGPHLVVTLKPNQVFRTAVVWSRTTSKVGCPSGQPKAPAGTYVLRGRNLDRSSAGAKFDLL